MCSRMTPQISAVPGPAGVGPVALQPNVLSEQSVSGYSMRSGRAAAAAAGRCCGTTAVRGPPPQPGRRSSRGARPRKLWRVSARSGRARPLSIRAKRIHCGMCLPVSSRPARVLHSTTGSTRARSSPPGFTHMANRDKARRLPARPDRQRSGMVRPVAREHPRAQRLRGGAGLHRPAGAGAGPHVAARHHHPRCPDAGHARVRGLPGAAQRSRASARRRRS